MLYFPDDIIAARKDDVIVSIVRGNWNRNVVMATAPKNNIAILAFGGAAFHCFMRGGFVFILIMVLIRFCRYRIALM